MAMNIRRKKSKHKKRIRYSTKMAIFTILSILIVICFYILASGNLDGKTEEREEKYYKYSDDFLQDYSVSLKKNQYMTEDNIEDGQSYITNLVNGININYNYIYKGETADKINCEYSVNAVLKSTYSSDGKEETIWNKKYAILESKNQSSDDSNLNITESVNVNLSSYNNLLNKFKDEMQIAINSYLVVTFEANITAYVDGDMVISKYSKDLNIEIEEKVCKISCDENEHKEEEKTRKIQTTTNPNVALKAILIIVIISSIFIIIKIQLGTKVNNNIKNLFKLDLNQILSSCGDKIVQVSSKLNINEHFVIEIKDINELIKLSDELYKPILYYQVPNKREAWFYIMNEKETYRYILK